MSRYLSIAARNEPFPLGNLDPNGRLIFSTNFDVQIDGPIANLENEIITKLESEGVGSLRNATNPAGIILIGPSAVIPTGDGPFINLLFTGGVFPIEFHNNHKIRRPSFQVLVYSKNYFTGREKAYAVWNALHGVRHEIITS